MSRRIPRSELSDEQLRGRISECLTSDDPLNELVRELEVRYLEQRSFLLAVVTSLANVQQIVIEELGLE
jgi:hypothetical protein